MQAGFPPVNTWTGFDLALGLLVLLSTLVAFQRGFIRALFSIGGLIAGILIASWNYVSASQGLERWINDPQIARIIAFLLILSLVMALVSWVAELLRRTVAAVGLGFLDRAMGAIFGFFRGILLGVAAMMAFAAFVPNETWVRQSVLAPYFLEGARAISFVVPEEFRQQIASGAKYILQGSPELLRPHHLQQPM